MLDRTKYMNFIMNCFFKFSALIEVIYFINLNSVGHFSFFFWCTCRSQEVPGTIGYELSEKEECVSLKIRENHSKGLLLLVAQYLLSNSTIR